ncbi:hypothetical protein CPT03_07900 [Pedobacter ginsengisoli]|uniref:Outer membrane protein beta-barrel domain-containing protein n=2 Tax=Pedobacter ginsengisoli TaxID=363852 RepID=A0A2D1U465_9SPHI|nr:hypothetical protein CPT03_07900 [Pedobacter ginsengisoli]
MEYKFNNGVDNNETMTKERLGGLFVSPDVQLGVKVNKYISLEAGVNYRYNIGEKSKRGLSTNNINGLGAQVLIVGHLPF